MNKFIKKRLLTISITLLSVALGVWILLDAMSDSIIFFYSPSQLNKLDPNKEIRVGGIVKPGSIDKKSEDTIEFCITDNNASLNIRYKGMIPALFRENQAIVAKGKLTDSIFIATELLAKHDENYMPHEDLIKSSDQTLTNPH